MHLRMTMIIYLNHVLDDKPQMAWREGFGSIQKNAENNKIHGDKVEAT